MNNRLIIVVALASCALAACAQSSKITLPDGSKGFTVNCDGAAMSWSLCFQKAGELCPAGYDQIGSNQNTTPTAAATPTAFMAIPQVERVMVIRCK